MSRAVKENPFKFFFDTLSGQRFRSAAPTPRWSTRAGRHENIHNMAKFRKRRAKTKAGRKANVQRLMKAHGK